MNLQQTIDELEQQAAKYAQAANALRALQDGGGLAEESLGQVLAGRRGKAAAGGAKRAYKKSGAKATKAKRVVSPETRARLAESMRARHQQKKQARAAEQA